jgi:ABC-type tungstate transport system substrate-binding protein
MQGVRKYCFGPDLTCSSDCLFIIMLLHEISNRTSQVAIMQRRKLANCKEHFSDEATLILGEPLHALLLSYSGLLGHYTLLAAYFVFVCGREGVQLPHEVAPAHLDLQVVEGSREKAVTRAAEQASDKQTNSVIT